jgi:hypothetical protein
MVGEDEQVIDAGTIHHLLEGAVSPRVLGVGKARIFLRDDRAQARLQFHHG